MSLMGTRPVGNADVDALIEQASADLVATGAAIEAAGLCRGSSGNMSLRVGDDLVVMTPSGSLLGDLDPGALSVVAFDGRHLAGEAPSKELPLHLEMYRKNPRHRAVIHVHSPFAIAASCLEPWSEFSALPPLTPYFVMRAGQTPLVPYAHPGSNELAGHLRQISRPFSSALLQNHGQITSNATLESALDSAIEVEEAARATLLTAGKRARTLTPDEACELAERNGTMWTP